MNYVAGDEASLGTSIDAMLHRTRAQYLLHCKTVVLNFYVAGKRPVRAADWTELPRQHSVGNFVISVGIRVPAQR